MYFLSPEDGDAIKCPDKRRSAFNLDSGGKENELSGITPTTHPQLPWITVTQHVGDMLYVPPKWWHYVISHKQGTVSSCIFWNENNSHKPAAPASLHPRSPRADPGCAHSGVIHLPRDGPAGANMDDAGSHADNRMDVRTLLSEIIPSIVPSPVGPLLHMFADKAAATPMQQGTLNTPLLPSLSTILGMKSMPAMGPPAGGDLTGQRSHKPEQDRVSNPRTAGGDLTDAHKPDQNRVSIPRVFAHMPSKSGPNLDFRNQRGAVAPARQVRFEGFWVAIKDGCHVLGKAARSELAIKQSARDLAPAADDPSAPGRRRKVYSKLTQ